MSELYGESDAPQSTPSFPMDPVPAYVKYILYMYVDQQMRDLDEIYNEKVIGHNQQLLTNDHPDSGFDLFTPNDVQMSVDHVNKIDMMVKCKMVKIDARAREIPSAFYMYPRSSISKQKVRLANNVGIIDSGYRGNLCGMFDVIYTNSDHICEKHTRLLQICTPTLEPFRIIKVNSDTELGATQRGQGGFGSTGLGV